MAVYRVQRHPHFGIPMQEPGAIIIIILQLLPHYHSISNYDEIDNIDSSLAYPSNPPLLEILWLWTPSPPVIIL